METFHLLSPKPVTLLPLRSAHALFVSDAQNESTIIITLVVQHIVLPIIRRPVIATCEATSEIIWCCSQNEQCNFL